MAALASASASVPATEPDSPVPKIEMNSRSGATARSCASRIAKLARPAVVVSRPCLESTSTTMAVDDSARQAPTMSGTGGLPPARITTAPMAAAENTICRLPSPKTRRRIVFNRS